VGGVYRLGQQRAAAARGGGEVAVLVQRVAATRASAGGPAGDSVELIVAVALILRRFAHVVSQAEQVAVVHGLCCAGVAQGDVHALRAPVVGAGRVGVHLGHLHAVVVMPPLGQAVAEVLALDGPIGFIVTLVHVSPAAAVANPVRAPLDVVGQVDGAAAGEMLVGGEADLVVVNARMVGSPVDGGVGRRYGARRGISAWLAVSGSVTYVCARSLAVSGCGLAPLASRPFPKVATRQGRAVPNFARLALRSCPMLPGQLGPCRQWCRALEKDLRHGPRAQFGARSLESALSSSRASAATAE